MKKEEEPQNIELISEIPTDASFNLHHVSFRYIGSDVEVLKDLDLQIPANKITAIVGVSGKTTLMKLLLKFYEPNFDIQDLFCKL